MQTEPLKYGEYYHLYNRGTDGCNLFRESDNYEHFPGLYDRYISPVAETFAWVLMPNHFHLLVRVKENIGYKYFNTDRSVDAVRFEEHKWETLDLSACEVPDSVRRPQPYLHFSHLMNAYSKYFNKRFGRQGALFEKSFKRKLISHEKYLRQVILYIHNNPVHPVKYFKFFIMEQFYYTYVIRSLKDGKNYTGYTKNLKIRFDQHCNGEVKSTKDRRPLVLIYFEGCLNQQDATHREKYLKTYLGKMYLKNRLKHWNDEFSNLI